MTLGALWSAAWKLSGAPKDSPWPTKVYDDTMDLMPIHEDKNFLRSLHLKYLGQDDLPGSDAPKNPPPPPGSPAKKAAKKAR
ncbi:hypothetical protein TL10_01865 [Mycolicibacterium llatzerense]|uniref:Uncharacterized protein n=1 Tax=Mycolicibacterium llatzerense TaxID=280871 RepID=A0A0D1LCU6_9MYCO|nr:hypothetical protein TL10_01865 [Mycolicibacterium llatzerense]MCT7369367.1 hypothetical protein [Mycolicibacterium llatzerense]